jgi:hypothetical protein
MANQGRPPKSFEGYLTDQYRPNSFVDYQQYYDSPATAFLKYTLETEQAVTAIKKSFEYFDPKLKNQDSVKQNRADNLQHIIVALLPAIMGHFETFQKMLFANMFNYSIYLKDFNPSEFSKILFKKEEVVLNFERFASYRSSESLSLGILLADSLIGWHDPEIVNKHFHGFNNYSFYDNDTCNSLKILWQLRHSIVHTGGTITLPDSQKVKELNSLGGRTIVFEDSFIRELSRKMHKILEERVKGLGEKYIANLKNDLDQQTKDKIIQLFKVESSRSSWLKNEGIKEE